MLAEDMDKIRVFFILPGKYKDESEAADITIQAFEACKQVITNVTWVKESNCGELELRETDFAVFETFEGKYFDALKAEGRARIVGPWCLSICLMEGLSIPKFHWPIYNVAMYDVIVTSSHLPKPRKLEIKQKVQLMGGLYNETLSSSNTHLIADRVNTEKYILAAESGLKIMTPEWVDAVLEASRTGSVKCDDPQFDSFKCPPFHKLTISATGVSSNERHRLMKLIDGNGGKFTGKLSLAATDVLVCEELASMGSEKFRAAKNTAHIQCVTVKWVYDSVEKGYALPCNLYPFQHAASTPTKETSRNDPNFSTISAINAFSHTVAVDRTSLDETVNPAASMFTEPKISLKRKIDFGDDVIESIDLKKVKAAGQFLDNCCVYLAGFEADQKEKLNRILNMSGATRFTDLNDRVTHIIIGDVQSPEVQQLFKVRHQCRLIVSSGWLLESVEMGQAVCEEQYIVKIDFDEPSIGSPLSKNAVNLLRSSKIVKKLDIDKTIKPVADGDGDGDKEIDLVQQYLLPSQQLQEDTLEQLLRNVETTSRGIVDVGARCEADNDKKTSQVRVSEMESGSQEVIKIFEGLRFAVFDCDDETYDYLECEIENAGGISFPHNGSNGRDFDFAVVPLRNVPDLKVPIDKCITELYIKECCHEGRLKEIQYCHRPLLDSEPSDIFDGCVMTISGYSGAERSYLSALISRLGGVAQDQFARIDAPDKNVRGCTHLICAEPEGRKYQAARKWAVPVLTKDWLLSCAAKNEKLPLPGFVLNESLLSSIEATPKKSERRTETKSVYRTPIGKIKAAAMAKSTPGDFCSQVTPVSKIMEEVRQNHMLGTPKTPVQKPWCDVQTPQTPYGAFIRPDPSPDLRKKMVRYINQFPDYNPPKSRRVSTPLSELKRQFREKVLGSACAAASSDGPNGNEEKENSESGIKITQPNFDASVSGMGESRELELNEPSTSQNNISNCESSRAGNVETPEKIMMQNKIQQLQDMLTASTEKSKSRISRNFHSTIPAQVVNPEMKDSQAFTVGWDYAKNSESEDVNRSGDDTFSVKSFMISGFNDDTRGEIIRKIEALDGKVSELSNYDPSCTHLICPKPARNEKTLACMAAGKWILHSSYVERSLTSGSFLLEEDFEFGNPKSYSRIPVPDDADSEQKFRAIHWWRKEITKRGYGAFNDMRAIVVATKRDPIIRVIEAGGGLVLDANPLVENVHVTHCLLEPRSVKDYSVYVPLAKKGVYCINTLYISEYLHRTSKDIRDCILPQFTKYYK